MRIRDLDAVVLRQRLAGPGLRLVTGPFVFNLRSRIPSVASGLAQLYPDFELEDPRGFADYHVAVHLAGGVRRFVRRQAIFDFDGFHPFKPLPAAQAFALLEWGMNWCIYAHAHEFLIVHGAVLEHDGEALLLPAPPGSGKSTLAAALMQRGWRLCSDELTLYDPGAAAVRALARPVSLKNESIRVMRERAPDAYISTPMADTAKGTVALMRPTAASVEQVHRPASPRWVVFPQYRAGTETALEAVAPAEMFMRLVQNELNYSTLREQGFRALSGLVDGVEGFCIEYGDLDAALERLEAVLGVRV